MSTAVGNKKSELEDLKTIRFVVSALFDISVEKLGHLRAEFQKNQRFYIDISSLYSDIKRSARSRGDLPKKTTNVVRRVFVALTSNTRFYGSINADVMRSFIKQSRSAKDTDTLVIGNTGKSFLEDMSDKLPNIKTFSFVEDRPTKAEIHKFLNQIEAYDEVHVFYPSFVSIFAQKIEQTDITHTASEVESEETELVEYIFEPELSQVLGFFETRIRYLLFGRVVLESELARTAARLFSINRSQDRADKQIKRIRRDIQKNIDTFNDLRLLESFAAISKWKK